VAGAGGVIFDSDGQNIVDYSWGLGKTTNNKVESLAVYMGLQIAHSRNIHILTILGDSELVIKTKPFRTIYLLYPAKQPPFYHPNS
jgi:ribonuclease HI